MKKELHVRGQLLFIMKVTFVHFFLTLALIGFAHAGEISAQVLEKQISVSFSNASLRDALDQIEKLTDVKFLYQSRLIPTSERITFSANREKLADVLDEILGPREITYEADGNQIVLTRQKLSLEDSTLPSVGSEEVAITVTGVITDESNQPLPGVNVIVKGTTNGATSDANGAYTISVPDEKTVLIFSFIGYQTREITVGTQTVINVSMQTDIQSLQEVVVIGYGQVERKDLTGSVAQVSNEQLQAVPVYNVEQALKARAAGVQVTQNSGQPGGRIEVRIRGGNSMIGNNQPLYVVDGFPVTGGIDFLNPADIESMDILKDASATAIYGARGANGVVIITTKRGKQGQKGKIELSSFYGIQQETNRYDLLNAREWATIANEWLVNGGQQPYFNLNEIEGPGTDWQDAILQAAPIQDHTLTFSGSGDKTRYSFSGNYYDQEGIIINTGVKRGTVRMNLDHDATDWLKLSVNLNLSRREQLSVPVNNNESGKGSILSQAASAPPTLPIYDANGLPLQIERYYNFALIEVQNPMVMAQNQTNTLGNTVVGNTALDISLTKNLSFRTSLGLEYASSLIDQYVPVIYEGDRGYARQENYYRSSFLNENVLTFTKEITENHNLSLIGGFTYQTNTSRNSGIGVSGFSNNTTRNYNLAAAETINAPWSGISEWTLASWLARANYSINDKYLFTASIRADGSSRFGANNKWAAFPSAAVAWRISEENFMADAGAISDLKLRASYGVTGNTSLTPYQSLDRMNSVRTVYSKNTDEIGFSPSGISNSDLKWETTTQVDVGFDLGLLNNRFTLSVDYFKKNTTDLLASVPLPPSSGFGSILQNIGEIQNKGFEFALNANILNSKVTWDVTASLSTNKNEVIEVAGGSDILGAGQNTVWSNTNIAREGEAMGSFYGYLEDGLDANGFIKYKDVHQDGVINSLDRVILGKPNPDFFYGLNTNVGYGNFQLSVFLEGVYGNQIFNATNGIHLNSFQRGNNQFTDIIGNYWTADNPNPNAKYPKISSATKVDISDRFIEDGSYLRLKSVRLAYNLPLQKWGVTWLDFAQVYFSGINLLTFTDYSGLDPEVNTRGGDDSPVVADRLQMGWDQSGYPNARTYALGVKFTF